MKNIKLFEGNKMKIKIIPNFNGSKPFAIGEKSKLLPSSVSDLTKYIKELETHGIH